MHLFACTAAKEMCSAKTSMEAQKSKTAPLIALHSTEEGLERHCDLTLWCWFLSRTDNNPQSQRLAANKTMIYLLKYRLRLN